MVTAGVKLMPNLGLESARSSWIFGILEGSARVVDKQARALENPGKIGCKETMGRIRQQEKSTTGKWGHPVRGVPSCPLPKLLPVTKQALLPGKNSIK